MNFLQKIALMSPTEEIDSPVPFKRHEIDRIVFVTCTFRPNAKIMEEVFEKMRKKLGTLNECPTFLNFIS
ncbi:hypothetical protein CRE_19806 [Caenorhabditis remanei]|uniref:Uncharacterized protein n=1 Tax=Caenorhabditis remanei TaxID=31234 RepID=E3MTE3_CAERE|nr:hypothetical protein CRE_19806 [Caenorhabditis remanei]